MTRRSLLTLGIAASASIASASIAGASGSVATTNAPRTSTPIKHLVVIFQENVTFDHYFGTYPKATNTNGEPFRAKAGTPSVNGLSKALLLANPNGLNPQRLGPSDALTCDQNHQYTAEQQAADKGLMDQFPTYTQVASCSPPDQAPPGLVMDYYDGNTVTALWNYAQRFAMSDNSFNTGFGPSTPGVLNLVSGKTHGATPAVLAGVSDNGTVYGDADPTYDQCSAGSTIAMSGTNIGDELNARRITWGWFQGGFAPTSHAGGTAVCGSSHVNIGGATVGDYSAHHEPFQYYASTANPAHLPPATEAEIGHSGQANHQYDLSNFSTTLSNGNMPSVSFLKAAKYQDGHAGYSDRLTSSISWSPPSTRSSSPGTGTQRQSSSPTTIRTAGMTTSHLRSSTPRRRPRTRTPQLVSAALARRCAGSRTGAATDSGCPCSSSRHGHVRTGSTIR
jgi:phospholipase C